MRQNTSMILSSVFFFLSSDSFALLELHKSFDLRTQMWHAITIYSYSYSFELNFYQQMIVSSFSAILDEHVPRFMNRFELWKGARCAFRYGCIFRVSLRHGFHYVCAYKAGFFISFLYIKSVSMSRVDCIKITSPWLKVQSGESSEGTRNEALAYTNFCMHIQPRLETNFESSVSLTISRRHFQTRRIRCGDIPKGKRRRNNSHVWTSNLSSRTS